MKATGFEATTTCVKVWIHSETRAWHANDIKLKIFSVTYLMAWLMT